MSIQWRKSSYSGGGGTAECVELAEIGAKMTIRDSKNPEGPKLALSPPRFTSLVAKIKRNQLDGPWA